MDCDKAHDRMHRYLDGEVTVWRRWSLTRHLDKCPPCADCYEFELEVRQVVSSRCRDTMPPDVKARLADALGIPLERPDEPSPGSGAAGDPSV